MSVLLISETIISTETAVVTPSDPICEGSDAGHREKSFGMTARGLKSSKNV